MLATLLNPLAQNDFAVEESFEAVDNIHSKPEELFECGKWFYSFDVSSLFTNFPASETVKIILVILIRIMIMLYIYIIYIYIQHYQM